MPRSLDLDRLKQFELPRGGAGEADTVVAPWPVAAPPQADEGPVSSPPARWPSREPVRDGQVSIKAPLDVIERFRTMCRDDRRTYADMLGILMDRFERR